jgi:hypothetical protein
MRLRLSFCRGILATLGMRLAGKQSHHECVRKRTCSTVKRDKKRANSLYLEVEVFLRKIGFMWSEFSIF